MAQITGVDYKQLEQGAIAANEKIVGLQQLMSTGFQGSKDDKDFLLNMAHMEHGQMKITIPESIRDKFEGINKDGSVALNEMSKTQQNLILSNKKYFEELTPAKVAEGQLTELQQINRNIATMAAYYRARIGQFVRSGAKELGIEGQFALLAHRFSLNTNNLIKYAESGQKFTGDMQKNMQKVVQELLGGNVTSSMKDLMSKLDDKLGLTNKTDFESATGKNRFTKTEEQRAADVNNKINESLKNESKIETKSSSEPQKVDINVTHSFNPTDSVSNSIYRETIKNHGIRQQLQATPDKRDFDYVKYADMSKKGGK
jgi:hypothetical protein